MSLESLSALKQLVQVRDQGANIQNDNLETAQKQVQQVGTGEAKRVDELNLEKVKAEYEVELTKARVDRLQSQLGAENKAVNNAAFITQGVAVLSIGDKAMNFYSDVKGGQKFADQTDGNGKFDKSGNQLVLGADGKAARFDESGNQLDKDKDKDKFMSGKIKVLDSKGVEASGNFKEEDFKGRTMLGRDFKGAGSAEIVRASQGNTSGFSVYNASSVGEDGVVAVTRANLNGSGGVGKSKGDTTGDSTGGVRVGFISKEKMDEATKGLTKDELAAAGGNPFAALMAKDPAKAEALFNSSGHRDVQRNESKLALSTIGQGGAVSIGIGQDNKPVQDLGKMKAGLIKSTAGKEDGFSLDGIIDKLKSGVSKGDSFSDGINKRVSGYFDANGTSKGDVGAMDTLKYGANAVLGVVEDVSPFFQAYLKMKSQRDTTADELQAEIAKLAAGRKRLKALEDAIMSPGAGAEGSAAGAGQAAAA